MLIIGIIRKLLGVISGFGFFVDFSGLINEFLKLNFLINEFEVVLILSNFVLEE